MLSAFQRQRVESEAPNYHNINLEAHKDVEHCPYQTRIPSLTNIWRFEYTHIRHNLEIPIIAGFVPAFKIPLIDSHHTFLNGTMAN